MVDIKKIKIKRAVYSFEINKFYDNTKEYNLIEKNPLQRFLDSMKRKKKVETKKKRKGQVPKKGINPILVAGAFGILAILILSVWIASTLGGVIDGIDQVDEIKPIIEMTIIKGQITTYGEKLENNNVAAIDIDHKVEGFDNASVYLTTYLEEPSYQHYIIEEPRLDIETQKYEEFRVSLDDELESRGIYLNTIEIEDLKTIPDGALVIIPTARIPRTLIEDNNTGIESLLERGVDILYIGKDFSSVLNDDGELELSNDEDIERLGIGFSNSGGQRSTEIDIFQPQYIVTTQSEKYTQTTEYGVVSILEHIEGGGHLIFVPQTIDGGWTNTQKGATTITKIIRDNRWITKHSAINYSMNETNSSEIRTFFTAPFEQDEIYVDVEIRGIKNKKEQSKVGYLKVKRDVNGELYITQGISLVSSSISGKAIRIAADLFEEEPKSFFPKIRVLKDGEIIKEDRISEFRISGQTQTDFDINLDLNEGEYIIEIIDDAGEVYAKGYANSVPVEVRRLGLPEDNVFTFVFEVDGQETELENIELVIDSGELGEYSFQGRSRIDVDIKPALGFGGELPEGEHIFEFSIGELKIQHVYGLNRNPTIFEEPIFFLTIILVIGILLAGTYFANQQKPKYFIDIPDFPPTEFSKVKIDRKFITKIIEKENKYHRWVRVPLTLSEIKSGLRKTFYKGRNLNASDFNISYILDKLKKSNEIIEELEYYIPIEWKDDSPRYLAMFRKIRDLCVVNAVPFTKKGQEKDCDSKITIIGQEIYIHIFDLKKINRIMENLIKNIDDGINIVLVKDVYEKQKFEEILTSPTRAASIIKFENEGKSISIMTVNEFENMIREMKS